MTQLRGVLSAVSTPFTADDALDEEGLRALVERTVSGGVHGLVPCGSTGEFMSMTNSERRQVFEIVQDQAGGRVPVVPHIGALTTQEAVELAKHAEQNGAAAVMAVAPFYEPLDLDEIKDYFRAVAGAVSVPVVIYNLPVATGVNLEPHVVAGLARETENIAYVKDTTGDFSQAARLIHDHGDDINTFVGQDTLFLGAMVEGAAGSIVGASNLIPRSLVNVWDNVQAGALAEAKQEWNRIFPLMQFLISGPYPAAVKGGLDILGYSAGPPRRPLAALAGERRDELEQILKVFATS
jgi:4-hydroxy-tetrahydrodipicolinate synthase